RNTSIATNYVAILGVKSSVQLQKEGFCTFIFWDHDGPFNAFTMNPDIFPHLTLPYNRIPLM
ncbi:hypothetical protein, partial [Enterobacter roggenkampii]|uniref:hypothetical protein n=1 Tax=Enterobacter roggenkampii TaxID=1812935 RepID=UPI00197ACA49